MPPLTPSVLPGAHDHPKHAWLRSPVPRLFITRIPEQPTKAEVTSYLAACAAYFDRSEARFAWVVDGTRTQAGSALLRKDVAEHLIAYRDEMTRRCVGMSHAVPGTFIRGMMQAIYWVAPPGYPTSVFDGFAEALAWAEDRIPRA